MNLRTKVLFSVIGPLVLQVLILLGLGYLLQEAEQALHHQLRVSHIQYLSIELQKELNTAVSSAFMYRLTSNEKLVKKLDQSLGQIRPVLEQLKASLQEAKYDQESINKLDGYVQGAIDLGVASRFDDPTSRYKDERLRFSQSGAAIVRGITEETTKIDKFATRLNSNPEAAAQARTRVVGFLYLAFGLDITIACGLVILNMVSIVNRIDVLKENTIKLARNEPLRPVVGGNDEITELDSFFRMMALSLHDSNQRRTALVKNSADVLCSIDIHGNFVSVSDASRRIWGYQPESLLNTPMWKISAATEQQKTIENLKTAIKEKSDVIFDNIITKADGTVAEMRWSVTWSPSESSLFAVVRDVSRENELTRMKQALMDTAAHDLRAPLTSIVATLSNLSMGVLGDLTPEVKSKLERTEAQATRLVRLVSDLLDSEKISSGKITFHKVPTRIVPLVEEGLSSLAALASEKDVSLTIEALPDIVVEIDRDRITQVLVNLISNAIKFSPPGAKVTVSGESDLNSFSVHVIDHGVGVPDEKKESIFERFEQGAIFTQHGKGLDSSGLGLTIARTIIEGHGGTIGVRDTTTGGSVFWFTVPMKSTI